MSPVVDLVQPALFDAARPWDAERIAEMLSASAPETIPLSTAEVRAHIERFVVLRDEDGRPVAVAALHPVDREQVELRSVTVDDACRGRGFGRAIVVRVLEEVVRQGRRLFCFTFRPDFFARLGFESVPVSGLPVRTGRPSELDGRKRLAMAFEPGALLRQIG